jgi:Flp pilus assembly protein TadG
MCFAVQVLMDSTPRNRETPHEALGRSSPRRRVVRSAGREDKGQSLVEFALMVPLLFLLMINALNFGGFIYAWLRIANAARGAASYGGLGSSSPGSPSGATTAQISTLITNDTASLRGTVAVCVNKNATAGPMSGTCSFTIGSIPADPEGPPYQALAVDLQYTYTPFIPSFSFPGMGIYSTIPPTTIQRRGVTRVTD